MRKSRIRNEEEVKIVQEKNKKEKDKERNAIYNGGFVKDELILPVEEKERIEQQYEIANSYINLKQEKLEKEWKKGNSKMKEVGDYIYKKLYDLPMISKDKIQKDLKISRGNVDTILSKLNLYNGYPLTIIPVYEKKGFIQSVTNNEEDSIKWDRIKSRTITSMEYIKEKGELSMKKLLRDKVRKKIVVEQKK